MELSDGMKWFSPQRRSLASVGIGEFPLEEKVQAVLQAPAPGGWTPSGRTSADYLDVMERIVVTAQSWVDEKGAVIDPVLKTEFAQSTPRFVSPAAILLHFGRASGCAGTAFKVMDYCCEALSSGRASENSPDFWMRELATAFVAFKTVADGGRLSRWAEALGRVEAERINKVVSPDGSKLHELHNWAVYAAAGEAMRQSAGLKAAGEFLWGDAYFERYVGASRTRSM